MPEALRRVVVFVSRRDPFHLKPHSKRGNTAKFLNSSPLIKSTIMFCIIKHSMFKLPPLSHIHVFPRLQCGICVFVGYLHPGLEGAHLNTTTTQQSLHHEDCIRQNPHTQTPTQLTPHRPQSEHTTVTRPPLALYWAIRPGFFFG